MIFSLVKIIVDFLDRSKIEYVVIGGCAKIIYKQSNLTRDVDILINK
jgi:hypothetical protein